MPVNPNITRREFLRRYGVASSALTLSPFFLERFSTFCQAAAPLTRVYLVKNGDCFQNIAKLWELMGGVGRYISASDIVVIKANGQWPNQGYSHTGCIKAVIDAILQIPGFSGEILICDNVQIYGAAGSFGFDATTANRTHNWADHNWNSLAAAYQAQGKPVATKRWLNSPDWTAPPALPALSVYNPATEKDGWHRYFFKYTASGKPTYISCPVFQSPLTSGRMIDLKNGVWEKGSYTSRRVRTICLPTLNNHGSGSGEDCGITSAIKCFYGATELHGGVNGKLDVYSHMHSSGSSDTSGHIGATAVGELVATYLQQLFAPVLYITAAMWSGWYSRTGNAAETKTVLACENPVTLDYIASRDVISPYASWLNPDQDCHTRQQILGCNARGIGTIDPRQFEVIAYDFNHPTAHRLDVERKIRDFKANQATEQEVKDAIKLYMQGD